MQRFLCDAIIRAVFVEPDGSIRRIAELRTPNRAQRRALAAIYSTCAHPDCTIPVTDCKAHHIVWYSQQGPTPACLRTTPPPPPPAASGLLPALGV